MPARVRKVGKGKKKEKTGVDKRKKGKKIKKKIKKKRGKKREGGGAYGWVKLDI